MRFLLPAIGIVVLIATGIALQMRFPSKQVALADATVGVPVYETQADDVKALPDCAFRAMMITVSGAT